MPSSTLFVTFHSDHDAELVLAEYKLRGTSVSSLLCRYTIEVPLGKEKEFVNLLAENEHVKEVRECCLYGKERKREPRTKTSDRDPKRSKNEKW